MDREASIFDWNLIFIILQDTRFIDLVNLPHGLDYAPGVAAE
jgi:hypothetical protein